MTAFLTKVNIIFIILDKGSPTFLYCRATLELMVIQRAPFTRGVKINPHPRVWRFRVRPAGAWLKKFSLLTRNNYESKFYG